MQNSRRALDPCYASAELLWYLSRKKTCEALLPYAPQYERFLHDGAAYGSYGWRLAHGMEPYSPQDQLNLAIAFLKQTPDTRQCYIALWRPDDLHQAFAGKQKDLPCTLGWQLLVRDGELHWVTYMRSNDVWLGMPYDVYAFTCLQFLVAGALGLEVGTYTHNVGSLHLYEKNEEAAAASVGGPWNQNETPANCWLHTTSMNEDVAVAIEMEDRIRRLTGLQKLNEFSEMIGRSSMLCDAVACCARKWGWEVSVQSPALRHALKQKGYGV